MGIGLGHQQVRKGEDAVSQSHFARVRYLSYDWQEIAEHAQLIVDTRNAMKNVQGRRGHIVSA